MNNLTIATRQFLRRPGLSFVVIVMLAVGIGTTTATFSTFHQILLRPLPVAEPERLVNIREPGPKEGQARCSSAGPVGYEYCFSYPIFRDLEAEQTVFTGLAAHYALAMRFTRGDRTQGGLGLLVSGSYFGVLNLEPAIGRLIGPQDEPRIGEAAVVVLSHDYWQSSFGGNVDVLGQALTVNGQQLIVIGVAPPGFTGTTLGNRPEVFIPLTLRWLLAPNVPRYDDDRRSYWLHLFGRLRPEVTIEQASAAVNALHRGILDEVERPLNSEISDDDFQQRRLAVEPGARGETSFVLEGTARPLTLLLAITLVVLLIVCINLANLLLALGASRGGEMAVRASMGASPRHLVLQLFTELFLLALIGVAISLPVAAITLGIATSVLPDRIADGLVIGLDPAATMLATVASLLTVFAFGLIPALSTSRADLGLVLKSHTSKSSGSRALARFRGVLVTAQIAFSMMLLVLAGLFAQSLMNVARVSLGMNIDSVVSFLIAPPADEYSAERTMALYDRLEEELAAQPGVVSVTSARIPVIANSYGLVPVSLEGFEPAPGTSSSSAFNTIGTGFFDTLSIPLLRGRDFTAADTVNSDGVAIVNESFVRRYDLDDGALGRRFSTPLTGDVEIVGVVADAKYSSVKNEAPSQFFVPRRLENNVPLFFYVRASIDPDALTRTTTRVVSGLDPALPINRLMTMERQLQENVYLDRLTAILSAGFAGLATLLASIGLYSVLAYSVEQRTRELGLRLALGAAPGRLRAMVLKQVGLMAVAGGLVGLALALALGRFAEAMLFGLTAYDPVVLLSAVIVLSAVVFSASYVPARRASAIAPMEALRYE